MTATASPAAAVPNVSEIGTDAQSGHAGAPLAGVTLSQRAVQTDLPPPPPPRHSKGHNSFPVRLAVGCAIAAATVLMAIVAIALSRHRRRRRAAGKPGQFAVGVPPASPPKALPREVGEQI